MTIAPAAPRCTPSITPGTVPSMPDTAPAATDKVRENRLRRMAQRQHLTLTRARVRDTFATDYGIYFLDGERIGDLDAIEARLTRRA